MQKIKKIILVLFLIFSILPMQKIFAQSSNTGFVSGNIWYSKGPFEEGDKVKIYTFVFNPDSRELSGTVIFFDKTVLLGKKEFIIPAKEAEDVSIDWTVTAGDHVIFGKIENAKFLISDNKYEEVYITENETEKSSHTVSKKITSTATDTISEINNAISSSISDITKIVGEKTPDSIAQPMVLGASTIENFRQNIVVASENKKEEVKKEIKTLENAKVTLDSKTAENTLLKPFKYVELFFLTIFSYITNNQILFYGILIIVAFFLLRYVWKKVF